MHYTDDRRQGLELPAECLGYPSWQAPPKKLLGISQGERKYKRARSVL